MNDVRRKKALELAKDSKEDPQFFEDILEIAETVRDKVHAMARESGRRPGDLYDATMQALFIVLPVLRNQDDTIDRAIYKKPTYEMVCNEVIGRLMGRIVPLEPERITAFNIAKQRRWDLKDVTLLINRMRDDNLIILKPGVGCLLTLKGQTFECLDNTSL